MSTNITDELDALGIPHDVNDQGQPMPKQNAGWKATTAIQALKLRGDEKAMKKRPDLAFRLKQLDQELADLAGAKEFSAALKTLKKDVKKVAKEGNENEQILAGAILELARQIARLERAQDEE